MSVSQVTHPLSRPFLTLLQSSPRMWQMYTQPNRLPLCTPETNFYPVLTSGCMTQVLFLYNSSRSVTHGLHASVMDRLREMNVRTLLNTRIDLNSLKAPPPSPYTCSTPTSESTCTPDLSPTFSTPDLFESPCSTPPPVSPHLPSFILPPPVVQPEDFCATIRTTDGREINADLIVGFPSFFINSGPYLLRSSSVQARPITPRFWKCCHPNQLITRADRRHTSHLLCSLESRWTMERSGSLNTHTFL